MTEMVSLPADQLLVVYNFLRRKREVGRYVNIYTLGFFFYFKNGNFFQRLELLRLYYSLTLVVKILYLFMFVLTMTRLANDFKLNFILKFQGQEINKSQIIEFIIFMNIIG